MSGDREVTKKIRQKQKFQNLPRVRLWNGFVLDKSGAYIVRVGFIQPARKRQVGSGLTNPTDPNSGMIHSLS